MISTERSLDVLADCRQPRAENPNSLPTWCPDWSISPSNKREHLLPPSTQSDSSFSRFNACKTLAGSCRIESLKDKEGEMLHFALHISGLVIDHIEVLGEVPPSITKSKDETYNDILMSWLSTISRKRVVNEELKAELERTATVDDRGYPGTREHRSIIDISNYQRLRLNVIQGNRCFFITRKGYMGTAPPHVLIGDIICVLPSVKVPILVRKVEKFYILVGEAYVSDRFMEGRAVDEMEVGERSLQEFVIH